MRKAAGILMIILGMTMMGTFVFALSEGGIHDYGLPFILFVIISAIFILTGGVFCLKRKYWKLCFTSSLLLLIFCCLFFLFIPSTWFFLPGGILPIIFVCVWKEEWKS